MKLSEEISEGVLQRFFYENSNDMQKSGIEINAINISTKENVDKKEGKNVEAW